jgi:exopolysaccharide biosynthesis protein
MKQFIKNFSLFFFITIFMLLLMLYSVMWICVNGPSSRARELFVLSVRETSAVGFLANLYCTEEEIVAIEAANSAKVDTVTDTSLINIAAAQEKSQDNPDNTPEQSVPEKEAEGDIPQETEADEPIEFHNVSGSTYKGIMMIVKDPSRVMVGTSSEVYSEDVAGKKVLDMLNSYGAIGGVNAGGFEDPKGAGNGGIPKGLVISEGTLRYGDSGTTYEVIGMNRDNVLVVGSMTAAKALEIGIRDAVSFGPVLVVNGEATAAASGGGLNPRTAIGQRQDGAILLLVIDGRQSSSLGASYLDITNIMLEYGAVNAANLDGGSSSVMYYEGELLNSCSSLYGPREMPTCIVVK